PRLRYRPPRPRPSPLFERLQTRPSRRLWHSRPRCPFRSPGPALGAVAIETHLLTSAPPSLPDTELFHQHPALIVPADNTMSLTVVRSLGRRGVPAYCAYSADDALAPLSRYCRASFRLPKDENQAIAAILKYGETWKTTRLIGLGEAQMAMLN